ncbi:MAG: hypothetical protein V1720_16480 [bacterium]
MKKALSIYAAILLNVCLVYCQNHHKDFPILKGPYLGQKPPGTTPELFLPEVFNMYKYLHGKLVFAPDGKEVFWVITTREDGVDIFKRLFINQRSDETWIPPTESFFSESKKENGPTYSADGKRLYYQSRANLSNDGGSKDIDIWFRERAGDGWSAPYNIGLPVNTSEDESQPWISTDGSIYFCRDNKNEVTGKSGGSDIFYSKYIDGKYSEPVCLGSEINSEYAETEPTMSPDNSYLVFMSNRPGGFSRMMNLYVSFRTPNGGWTKAICLSHELKIENTWFPTLSYDGKFLFFCGGYPVAGGGYSNSNYYWVSTEMIEKMNPHK